MINWDLVSGEDKSTPAQELASVTGLLSALAERRFKAQQQDQEQAMERAKLAQQAAHQQALEEYNRQTLEQTQRHQAAVLAQQRNHDTATLTAQKQQHVAGVVAQARQMTATDPDGARQLLIAAGAEEAPQLPPLQPPASAPAPPATPAPQGRAGLEPPPFVPQSPGVFPGAQPPPSAPMPPMAPTSPLAQAQPSPAPPAPTGPPSSAMHLRMPAGGVLDIDPKAMEAQRAARAEATARAFVTQVGPHVRGAAGKRALEETVGMIVAPTWDGPKEDPHGFLARRTHELEQAGLERERMTQTKHEGESNKSLTRGQRAETLLKGKLTQFDNLNDMKRLGREYSHLLESTELLDGPAPAQKRAIDLFVGSAKNGTVTSQSLQYVAGNMAGGMAQLQTAIQKVIDGRYSDPDVLAMKSAIKMGTHALKQDANRKREAFVEELYHPSMYEMQANVDPEYNARFTPFGFPAIRREKPNPGISPTGERIMSAATARPGETEDPRLKLLKQIQEQNQRTEEALRQAQGARR